MIKLIKRKKIVSFVTIEWSLFVKTSLSLVKIWPTGLEKKIFKFLQCNFAISLLSPLSLEEVGAPLFEQIESYHPRMLFAKFRWNWPNESGEEYLPWEKSKAHHLSKLEAFKDALHQVRLKFAKFWSNLLFQISSTYSNYVFRYFLPLEKAGPIIE